MRRLRQHGAGRDKLQSILLLILGLSSGNVLAFCSGSTARGGMLTPRTRAAFTPFNPASPSSSGSGAAALFGERMKVVASVRGGTDSSGRTALSMASLGPVTLPLVVPQGISPLAWDGGVSIVALLLATVWLKIWTTLAGKGVIDPKVSRKVIHSGSGPLFMLTWPFFSSSPGARFVAGLVPLALAVKLTLAGLGKGGKGGKELSFAVSRSGDESEALKAPLTYVLVLGLATVVEWRSSILGLLAVTQLAVGDGLADLVGRRVGGKKWWFSDSKSYAGSAAFAIGSFVASLGLIQWLNFAGCLPWTVPQAATKVALVSAACAVVEVLPLGDDNISVPLAAAALGRFLFHIIQ